MTAEYLLDAMGLIDDDLIQDVEVLPAPTRLSSVRRWTDRAATLAACLVLVIALGYVVSNLGMGGDSAAPSASTGNAMPSSSAAADISCGVTGDSTNSAEQATSSTPTSTEPTNSTIFLHTQQGTLTYALSGECVEELPEHCRALGELASLHQDGKQEGPVTDGAEYEGCPLWAEGEEPIPAVLYVQLPDGRYALAELVQP